jgi:hypothetical protein
LVAFTITITRIVVSLGLRGFPGAGAITSL